MDQYSDGRKVPCEHMEVDHLVSLFHAWNSGVCGENLKRLANDPRNLRFTHWQTNRAKGALSPEEFADTLPRKVARNVLADADALRSEYNFPKIGKASKRAASLARELDLTRVELNSHKQQLAGLRATDVIYRGQKTSRAQAVRDFSYRVSKRVSFGAFRNVSSMVGEAMPAVGASVVVGVTALEVRDACMTLRDTYELNVAFNPDLAIPDEVTSVCAIELPSQEEIYAMILESPETAWGAAAGYLSDLPEFGQIEFDWWEYWSLAKASLANAGSAVADGANTIWEKPLEEWRLPWSE
ncbi:hypothetical protein [Pelagimonas sp. KU-00592-HH]|uniref:hypothetical protein n=1 Tax=Pelagimonas sp. KU-00592-HH TaxID=3127651 RepID=UPI00333F6CC2